MRSAIYIPLLVSLLDVLPALAIKFDFHVRTTNQPHKRSRFAGRADVSGGSNSTGVPVSNVHNTQYISNIALGGVTIPVLLDTGSSDLWVAESSVPNSKSLNKSVTLSYAIGQAKGTVNTAQLVFDSYTVEDQAFLLVTDTSTFSTDLNSQGYSGLVGLGPNDGSLIRKSVGNAAGDTMLNRIFQQNKTTSNYISFTLDRKGDPGDAEVGQLTISEVVPGLEAISSQPKLPVQTTHKLTQVDQHWQVLTDKNSITGPDGLPISIKSIVPSAPSGQLVAVFDSGFTLPQVPRTVSDAIYGRVQGAVYNSDGGYWTVPCDQFLTLSFSFGGQQYPIHPLDISSSDFNATDSSGNPVCIGLFQPITSAFSLLGEYDMILGMGFLRNTYTLLDFGDFVDGTSNDRGNPFVQLLSLTNANDAKNDFIQTRLGGKDTTGDANKALLPANQTQHSPVSAAEKKAKYEEMILSRWPYILLGCLVFLFLIIGCCIWRCCCRKDRKAKTKSFLAHKTNKSENTVYMPLKDQGGSTIALTEHGKSGHYGQ